MKSERGKTILRCAVYTRVSTEHGLEQEFNSLDNQREASEAYIKSQAHEGWKLVELFDAHQVSFVSVTQAFNTTTSMGRLTLNVLYPSPSSSARSLVSGSE